MCKIVEYIVAIFLLGLAYKDWKTKRVSVWALIAITVITLMARIFWIKISFWGTLGGIAIGFLFLGLSKLSGEAIGYGDSWLILVLGIYLGGVKLLQMLFAASCLASIVSMIMCVGFRCGKKHRLPYIPFLTIAYLGGMLL